jgi:hypothetical protein
LFLACQHLSSGTNLRECEDQGWFKVEAVPVFRFDGCQTFSLIPCYEYPRLKTTALKQVVQIMTTVLHDTNTARWCVCVCAIQYLHNAGVRFDSRPVH